MFLSKNSGDSFFYGQNIVSLEQLQEGVTLFYPNDASLYLPPGFHQQIEHVCIFLSKKKKIILFQKPLLSFPPLSLILSLLSPLFLSPSLLQDYKDAFGDPIVRYSCISVNLILTDTILLTDLSIDSSVLGASFYVFVNGTSLVSKKMKDYNILKYLIMKTNTHKPTITKKKKKKKTIIIIIIIIIITIIITANPSWTQRKTNRRSHSESKKTK